ncbi:mannose-P-dolichol utilization defect 1 protein-like [Argonauta hians]
MANIAELIISLVQLICPQPCFDIFFVEYDFFHIDCLKLTISKIFSYGIILGSVLVKLPQIIKIIKSQSGTGINLFSVTMELGAISASICYGFASKFPFSSYGESVFLGVQTTIIGLLVLHYQRKTLYMILYLITYCGTISLLLSPMMPYEVLKFLQTCIIPVITFSKLLQATENYKNQSTGQLSAVTIFLLFFGAIIRIFTSMQETGDSLLMMTFFVSASLNGLIAFQVLYYWNSPSAKQLEKKRS